MPQPERIGRYRVIAELGRGAMGVVYRARDEGLERDVAIKVMTRGASEAAARARFQREARAAAKLQHPNIIVIYELGEHDGAPFMVLELLEGMDLQRAIEGGVRPDPRVTVPVVLQILAGLGHAHEHGIVHRDVKPSNVFLPVARPAKIMDFGVARLAGVGITTTGAISGTPSYMSPEQVAGGEIDGRSDLFSAGLILYELVTGEKAIRGETVVALMYKILHEAADLSLIPQEPSWRRLREVLARSLARRPEERYPEARSMSADLALALADLGGSGDWTAPADQAVLVTRALPHRGGSAPAPGPPADGAPSPVQRPAAAPPRPASRSRARLAMGGLGILALTLAGGVSIRVWRSGSSERAGNPPVSSPAALASATPAAVALPAIPSPAATTLARHLVSGPPLGSPNQRPVDAAGLGSTVDATAIPLATPSASPVETAPPVAAGSTASRIQRAREAFERGRWAEALADARAALETAPTNAEATSLAQRSEAEIVIEQCLHNASVAIRAGDRERALEEIRRGFLIRPNDPRLLQLHREAVQQ